MAYQKTISLQGEIPPARFGHTSTSVGGGRVVLFGGAVGDVGRYTITADSYIYDINKGTWSKLHVDNSPSPRAAHAAACVESMQVVVFGGATGGGALSSDDLYLLDLRRDKQLSWIIVPTTGPSPGRRYGHVMVFCKPNLIIIGGNDGQQASNDVWFLNVEQSPFCWTEVTFPPSMKKPPKRVYHSADLCCEGPAAGMVVIFGGRDSESKSLNDTWGLRQHRDGSWDWIEAPIKFGSLPEPRYQHSSAFVGSKLVIIGGRNDDLNSFGTRAGASVITSTYLVDSHTKHKSNQRPNYELLIANVSYPMEILLELSYQHVFSLDSWRRSADGRDTLSPGDLISRGEVKIGVTNFAITNSVAFRDYAKTNYPVSGVHHESKVTESKGSGVLSFQASPKNQASILHKSHEPEIRLSSHAHAVHDSVSDFSILVRKISIDKLEDEGKKINKPEARAKLHWQNDNSDTVYDRIIRQLLNLSIHNELNPGSNFNYDSLFPIPWNDINTLCNLVYNIIKREDTVLNLRAPIKIYGDIHGQYHDLMRLFRLYKCPLDECLAESIGALGDIESNDYLFLGDYVDRGFNSLEVICLLFSLKCKYPTQIHLIRGNHEDPAINSLYGFQDECKRRLREDPANIYSCWQNFNKIFEILPLGAIIENKILCVHGGIGKSIHKITDISQIQRPISVSAIPQNELDQIILDLLWSDPTDSDAMLGTVPNEIRDPERAGHIVKFGPDRVHRFLTNNDLQLIIRAHECVMDGFERFAGGKLITLFSATNYCNHHKNAGALLFIRRDLTIVPKLIYPSTLVTNYETWDMRMAEIRPPTPPRSSPMTRDVIIDPP